MLQLSGCFSWVFCWSGKPLCLSRWLWSREALRSLEIMYFDIKSYKPCSYTQFKVLGIDEILGIFIAWRRGSHFIKFRMKNLRNSLVLRVIQTLTLIFAVLITTATNNEILSFAVVARCRAFPINTAGLLIGSRLHKLMTQLSCCWGHVECQQYRPGRNVSGRA